ncbi:MAG: peptide-methionine (S)-S-oxide reductase MsrA [Clostridia bacterium]|nr:peptide-methionine (S)-S-oxide reductase MsrA [Clostridia bacterium]
MKAYFAGGCFWCITPVFKNSGAGRVVCGYSGGEETDPTYEQVKAQKTGHRETIMVEYDPEKVSYGRLLDIFLENVDPFDPDGQFIDKGHSYSLAIYYSSEGEKELALGRIEKLKADSGREVFISLEPFTGFYEAEDYHQDYYLKNPEEFEKEMEKSGRKPADK